MTSKWFSSTDEGLSTAWTDHTSFKECWCFQEAGNESAACVFTLLGMNRQLCPQGCQAQQVALVGFGKERCSPGK